MNTFQQTKFLLILLTLFLLSACGGDKKFSPQSTHNYRLVSIDYDMGANDSIDNKYVYEYDDKGNNVKVENTDFNNRLLGITTTNIFDAKGNLQSTIEKYTNDSLGEVLRQWTFTYNQSGRKTSEKFEDFAKHHFDHWIEKEKVRTFYTKDGNIISVNRFTTDSHGNKLIELIDVNNDGIADKEINNRYSGIGKRLTRIIKDLNNSHKPILFREVRTYDSYGNILSITTSETSSNINPRVINYQYTYDTAGNILTSSTIVDSVLIDKRLYLWEKFVAVASFDNPVNWAGTGCKAGSVSVSGEKTNSLSILFDAYDAGKNAISGLKRSACSFSVPVNVPRGFRISLFTADWEGFVEGRGELSRKYFLAGQSGGLWKKNPYHKPSGDNFSVRDNINRDSFSTGCTGGQFNLRIESQIKTTDEDSYIAIDSADLHNEITLLLYLEACH